MNLKAGLIGITSLTLASCELPSNSAVGADQQKIEKIIAEYIKTHPEVIGSALEAKPTMIVDAIKKLGKQREEEEKKKAEEALVKYKKEIFQESTALFSGNADGKKIWVEFFDYNCPHCREMHKVFKDLIAQDKDVKVVYKPLPLFGKDSEYSARSVIAANNQGKFAELHEAFMNYPEPLDEKKILEIAKTVGIDIAKFEKDVAEPETKEYLVKIRDLASKLDITGAPYMIYESEIIPGRVELSDLKEAMNKKAK